MRLKTNQGLIVLTAGACMLGLYFSAPSDPAPKKQGTQTRPVTQKIPSLALPERIAKNSLETKPVSAPQTIIDPLANFDSWSRQYLQAKQNEKAALEQQGLALAEARRPVMKQLIKDNPRAAIEAAVPMVIRQQLPTDIVSRLEKRINQTGAFRVLMAMPLPGEAPVQPVRYETELKGGPTYETYPVQPPTSNKWIPGKAVNGIAIDSLLAISGEPTREMEQGEKPPVGKPVVFDCPVSGKQVLPPDEIPEVINVPAAEGPEEVYLFCDGSHRTIQNEVLTLYAEGGTGGAQTFTGILPSTATPSLGNVKVIVIPMTFADQNGVPSTEAALYNTLRDVADHYSKSSYGRISLTGVVTPPVKLKHNEAWYINRDTSNGGDISGTSVEMAEAREEARKLGFDWNDYDCTVVRHNGGPGSYGGLGGGSTVWVRGDSIGLWAHEIGHCFGLAHSNFWDTAGSSSIGAGANQEYGDNYDIMGNSGSYPSGQYNAAGKNQIRWLPSSFVQPITQSGQYRIYAFDNSALEPNKRYAMTIVKDSQRTYWGMVRTLFDTNPWMKNGIELGWRYSNGGGSNFQLIDTTNGSPFLKDDAAISLGSTFSDTEAGIHMTTVAANNSPRYVDVQVNFGSFPTNNAPTMTLAASATVVPLNGTVTFTATATDPDGDPLAYAWQHFGDAAFKTVSPNSNVISRQFTAAGTFIVTCTASDMKGGTVTRNQLITVGSPTSFTISGRVTIGGVGLSDVVITANNANGVITDADGYFTVANLTANTYTLTPLLYGYSFSELFNNSITVGPSFNGASFDATASSVVTIATTTNASEPSTNGNFMLTRSGDTSQDLVVNVNSVIGSAILTTDYTLAPAYVTGAQGFSTFTILAGSSTLSIVVAPAGDTLQEGPETIILQLGPGNGYLVGSASSATMVLGDDDTALPKVAFTANTARTSEDSASPAQFTVTRTGATTAALTVNYAVSGTATSGADFTALAGNVVIPATASSATIDIFPVNDSTSESIKTAVLTLSSNATYVIDPTANIGTATIYDDDLQTVSVTASDASAAEVDLSLPGAAANTGTFLVSRSGDLTAPLTVYYAFSAVTGSGTMALHGVDYEAMPGSIVIPAGRSAFSITIMPRFDLLGEGPEQVVLWLGANATNYIIGSSATATITITDNAADLPYIDVVNTGSANEGSSAVFRITVRGGTGTGALPISYTLSGTAVSGTDYTVSGTSNTTTGTSITLSNGAAVTRDVTINNTQDTVFEDLENVTLTLTPSATYQLYTSTASATMWLRDNENVNTVFVDTQVGTSGGDTFTEGASTTPVKFYVSRTGTTTNALNVNYTISGTATSGSDFTALAGAVTIPAAALGVDVPVSIINDTTVEGTESLVFNIAAGGYSNSLLPATMYIADNEVPTVNVGFATPSSAGLESMSTVNIPVTLSAAAPVNVAYKVSSQTGSGTANTTTSQPLGYWVRVVKIGTGITFLQSNDGLTWTSRTTATVSTLGNTSYFAGIAFAPGSTTSTQAVIDNFSITNLSVGSTQGIETDAAIGTATGAPTIASGAYTFDNTGAGILSASTVDNFRYVYLPITNSANCTVTARIVSIGGTASANARAGVMLRASTATGSVYVSSLGNNQPASAMYGLYRSTTSAASITPTAYTSLLLPLWTRVQRAGDVFTSAYSRDGTTWTNFSNTPTLALGPTALAGLVVAAGSDGSFVTATFDNVSLSGTPITSGLGGRSIGFVNEQGSESYNSGVWTVIGSGSSLGTGGDEGHFPSIEVNGDFNLVARLTSTSGTVSSGQAGVMVRSDRNGYARMAATVYNRSGPQIEQRFKLQGVTTAFGTGIDYTLAEGVLSFDGIETSKNIVLTVNNDTMDEPNNLITLQLFNPVGANLPSAQAFHGYTIIDDDNPPAQPYVGFASATGSVTENTGSVQIAVSLSAPATASGSVDFTTTDGTALLTSDYTTTTGTLTFNAGDSVAYIALPITDDATFESSETLTLTLSNPVGLQFGTITTHTLTITDDDAPSVSIAANDASATEAGDAGQFTLSRTGPTTAALAVTLTRAGTATNTTDYANIATAQTIPIGSASITIDVSPVQDTTNEGAETVILTVASGSGYVVGTPSTSTVTIADDDRSTVIITANDPSASENAGNPGQFTITRTAPTTVALSVAFTIAGTATSGSDYTAISSPVSIPIGQTSVTINVTVTNDGSIEGPEDVTLSLNTGSYDIGASSFASVGIADNDIPPTVFIDSPNSQGPLIAAANGIIVHAQVADDGTPAATTQTWSCVSGPGTATIESANAVTTAVTFSAPGAYVLRITATDTQFTVSDQITIVVGSGAVAANWFTQDMTPSSSQRGQSLEYNGIATVTGTGAGYTTGTDSGHIMVRPAIGDGSVIARLTSLSSTTALSGVTIRDSLARSGTRAVLGYVPGTGLQFRIRTAVSALDTVTTTTGLALPLWLKLERNATTNEITASHSPNGTVWTAIGTPTAMPLLNTDAFYGLTTTSNNTASTATAVFDNVTLTPAPSGPALLNEDSGTAPNIAGSASFDGTTYTVSGSPTGYFYGWQYYGDLDVRTRLVTFPSGAGSASGGIRIAESIEAGARMHLGRMPQGAYNGYYWTNIAGGSGGGVPSGISAGNWMRIVRSGNRLVGYLATHNSATNGPNAWSQIGQPQTVIMSTPVWVGFYVDNASGVGLNPCTFTNFTISPLSKAPIVSAVATGQFTPVTLDGTITDDALPAAFTSMWSQRTGPGALTFANANLIDTSATFNMSGNFSLRLTADDTGTKSFFDLNFTGYTTPFARWLDTTNTGNENNQITEAEMDADGDGLMNLMEYAIGTNGTVSSANPQVLTLAPVSSSNFLRLSIPKNPNAIDVTFTVEASSNLTSWSSAGLITETNTSTQLTVRDNIPSGPGVRRFMRVKVTRP